MEGFNTHRRHRGRRHRGVQRCWPTVVVFVREAIGDLWLDRRALVKPLRSPRKYNRLVKGNPVCGAMIGR